MAEQESREQPSAQDLRISLQAAGAEIRSLRKRRRFVAACAAMQGLLADSELDMTAATLAAFSVRNADALLSELDRPVLPVRQGDGEEQP